MYFFLLESCRFSNDNIKKKNISISFRCLYYLKRHSSTRMKKATKCSALTSPWKDTRCYVGLFDDKYIFVLITSILILNVLEVRRILSYRVKFQLCLLLFFKPNQHDVRLSVRLSVPFDVGYFVQASLVWRSWARACKFYSRINQGLKSCLVKVSSRSVEHCRF